MKKTILILHGWGLSGEKYNELAREFDPKKYQVFSLDLPGFGNEPLASKSMDLGEYVEFVRKFLVKKRIKSAIFIGHSFGGRVSTKFAYLYPKMVEILVLTGVPIIRHMTLKKKVASIVAKGGNTALGILPFGIQNIFRKALYHVIGEYDYFNAGALKETLSKIVKEDLTQYASVLTQPVVLIWGEKDTFTPKNDVEKIQRIIPQAQSIIIPGYGHSVIYQNPKLFYQALVQYI